MWFIAQLEGPSAVYNSPMALRLEGDLDPAALAALADVIAHDDAPRTRSRWRTGGRTSAWAGETAGAAEGRTRPKPWRRRREEPVDLAVKVPGAGARGWRGCGSTCWW